MFALHYCDGSGLEPFRFDFNKAIQGRLPHASRPLQVTLSQWSHTRVKLLGIQVIRSQPQLHSKLNAPRPIRRISVGSELQGSNVDKIPEALLRVWCLQPLLKLGVPGFQETFSKNIPISASRVAERQIQDFPQEGVHH